MKLIDFIRRIFDMDFPMEEANRKLANTLCIVNGKLEWVHSFDETKGCVHVIDNSKSRVAIKVISFLPFVPESGLYPLPSGSFLFITRIPKKIYNKSYNSQGYHLCFINPRKEENVTNDKEILTHIIGKTPVDIGVSWDKTIWWKDKRIGYIENSNNIVCTDSNFVQELKDWSRDA